MTETTNDYFTYVLLATFIAYAVCSFYCLVKYLKKLYDDDEPDCICNRGNNETRNNNVSVDLYDSGSFTLKYLIVKFPVVRTKVLFL